VELLVERIDQGPDEAIMIEGGGEIIERSSTGRPPHVVRESEPASGAGRGGISHCCSSSR
jgi:hypothetical protein